MEVAHSRWLIIFAIAAATACAADDTTTSKPPHIIFMVADDMGHADVGFTGASDDVRTPNIDALAAAGVTLQQHYVQPVCSPTRTSILTGRYPIRYGLLHHVYSDNDGFGLYLNETLVSQHLKTLGYATAMVGKSHLGDPRWGNVPSKRGFDTFYGYLTGEEDYYDHSTSAGSMHGYDLRNGTSPDSSKEGVYSAYLFAAEAQRIIRRHAATGGDAPLFLFLAWQSVHAPQQVPQHYVDPFNSTISDKNRRKFAGMVAALDEGIGNVTTTLAEVGMDENTLIVFTADNGAPCGPTFTAIGGCNWPLRGSKHTLWEGGVRSAAFVSGSAVAARAGESESGLLHATDWTPTLTYVGSGMNESLTKEVLGTGFPLDGFNVWHTLASGQASPRTEILHNFDPLATSGDMGCCGYAGLRSGKWKLLVDPGKPNGVYSCNGSTIEAETTGSGPILWTMRNGKTRNVSLFEPASDPQELRDVAAANPDVVAQLMTRLNSYIDAALPDGHGKTDPRADPQKQRGANKGFWTPWLPDNATNYNAAIDQQ